MDITERVLTLAKTHKITQKRIAEACGKPNSCVSDWKRYKTNPPVDCLIPLAKLFGVSVQWLLTGGDPEDKGECLPLSYHEQNLVNAYRLFDPHDKEEIEALIFLKSKRYGNSLLNDYGITLQELKPFNSVAEKQLTE